ncbi:ATP-dependent DNA ligase [Paludifilum halophilum]|uniref:DNA ligase (ATP) n=1 Tax=Paludifilum halophilum TaxID=1642702 RepID=A0A235BCA3_9BACL|nr:RNA ligase family protein [Paludifilum halophilum]OYD09669.1 DNA ligase [Paludifilum halophilum]
MNIQPIIPFEPQSTEVIPEGDQWIAQVKWDGVRVLTYFDGKETRLFNRKQNERTLQYPEFVDVPRYCSASSVILDGEIISLVEGKPSFHAVMKRDAVRSPERVQRARKITAVTYMLFDILYYNGEWITDQPLSERQEQLNRIITPCDDVQLVENFSDGNRLFQVIQAAHMEGIVCKDLTRPYRIKGKDRRWVKKKWYRDLIAVVGGVTFRSGWVNAILAGVYDQKGQLWYIGHVGTGKLTETEWKDFTETVNPLIIDQRPFVNVPDRIRDAVWVKPQITAKIQYAEWTQGRTLRQPSIQAFTDIPPEFCVFEP